MSMLLRKFSQIKKEENKVRSIDLVNWINEVRKEESIKSKLRNNDFHTKIEKYNKVMEERDMRKISHIFYEDSMNRKQKAYLLSKHEAMIFASTESDIVKAMIIQYMDNLEFELNIAIASKEQTKLTNKGLYDLIKEHKLDKQNAGIHVIIRDGTNTLEIRVSPSVYLYMLRTGNETQIKKMLFNRNKNGGTTLKTGNYLFNENNIGKKNSVSVTKKYNIVIKSDTNTAPMIVIQEFSNQQIESDTTLDFEVEEAMIILGKSIEGVKLGDDSQTVIDNLGEPDQIYWGDFEGFISEYLNQEKTEPKIKIHFSESSSVIYIEVYNVYDGKTKDGIGMGINRDSILKLLGSPIFTYSDGPVIDKYLLDPIEGYLDSQLYLYYDVVNQILGQITMMTRD